MSAGRIDYALPDLLEHVVDNRGRTCPTVREGFPLIATNCLKRGHKYPVHENVRYVDQETQRNWFRSHLAPQDILFVCKGDPGRVAVVPDPVPFCIAQDMVGLRADRSVVDAGYLYYRLLSPDVQSSIDGMHVGTMIPHFKRGDFDRLIFAIHSDLHEQRRIAEVLNSLDGKIASNNRLGARLAEIDDLEARKLIQGATDSVRLVDVATVARGVSYRSSELDESSETALVTLKSFDRTGRFSRRGFKRFNGVFRPSQVAAAGDILVAQTDLTQAGEVIGWAVRIPQIDTYERLVASLDTSLVRVNGEVPREYLLAMLRQTSFRDHCLSRSSGTTVLHLGRGAIESYEMPLAEKRDREAYSGRATIRLNLTDSLDRESEGLAATRDELLPLLMSGKVRVEDAEKVVEEVS